MTKSTTKRMVSFRLRKIDGDLLDAINGLANDELSELCRNGLRLILGMRKTRSHQVREQLIETRTPSPKLYVPTKPSRRDTRS